MKIAATSDTHGMLTPDLVPDCDVLILAGDTSPNWHYHQNGQNLRDAIRQLQWLEEAFIPTLAQINADQIILVAGNHDWLYYEPETRDKAKKLLKNANIVYLSDQEFVHGGIKFYGSPWTPNFHSWAFNFHRDPGVYQHEAMLTWRMIPDDANVVITHGPPFAILDRVEEGEKVGCPHLRDRLAQISPMLSIFGHIHESYGQMKLRGTTYANVALVSRQMNPIHQVPTFEV